MKLLPRLLSEPYVYTYLTGMPDPLWIAALGPWGQFWEPEGLTLIVEKDRAREYGLKPTVEVDAIILDVVTTLDQVGITAKVSAALAQEGISCNVVAGFHHDHFFVPAGRGPKALSILINLDY